MVGINLCSVLFVGLLVSVVALHVVVAFVRREARNAVLGVCVKCFCLFLEQ